MIEKNTGITHEKAVVACLLANTEAITNVIGFLKADMFSSRELGFIYKAIVQLFEQGKRTNYNLIDRTMQEMDRELFLQMNGLAYDPELFTMARDSSQVTEYALLIKDSYIRFRLTEHLNAVKLSLTDVGTPITTILGIHMKITTDISGHTYLVGVFGDFLGLKGPTNLFFALGKGGCCQYHNQKRE